MSIESTAKRGRRAVIDRLLSAVYRRSAERFVEVLLGSALVAVMVLTVINVAVGVLYLHGSIELFTRALVGAELCMLVGAAVWVPLTRSLLRPLRLWASGRRTPVDAEAAWRNIVFDLPRVVGVAAAIIALASVPAELYASHGYGLWVALFAIAFITLWIACGAVFLYLFAEACCAPVARELTLTGLVESNDELRGVSMSTKLLALPPVVSFYVGGLAAAVTRDSFGPIGRIAVGIGVAAALSLTVGLAATLLMRLGLVGPIDALVNAMERVGAGDFDVEVAPRTEDELGVLTHGFNRMLEGLRERESLHARNLELESALRSSLKEVRRQAEQLRESRARIVAAADAERRRVERDLHDGAQQQLVLLGLKLGMAERLLGDDPPAKAIHAELREDLTRALSELRDLAHGIYPAVLENEGLPGALREAARRAAIPTEVDCDGAVRYPPEVEAAVYFCCLEALQNAAKHAGDGARATVRVAEHHGMLKFDITDDGHGFRPQAVGPSAGVQNMIDRIGALGGTVQIESAPGRGTQICASLPAAT